MVRERRCARSVPVMPILLEVSLGILVVVGILGVVAATRPPLDEQKQSGRRRPSRTRRSQRQTFGPWVLMRSGPNGYVLRNVGPVTVHEVQIAAADPLLAVDSADWRDELEQDARQSFTVTRHKGLTDSRLTLTWRAGDEQQIRTWTVRLPLH